MTEPSITKILNTVFSRENSDYGTYETSLKMMDEFGTFVYLLEKDTYIGHYSSSLIIHPHAGVTPDNITNIFQFGNKANIKIHMDVDTFAEYGNSKTI